MTSTPYADQVPDARDAAREAVRRKMRGWFSGQLAEQVANEIADEALEAALPQIVADRISTPGAEGWGEPVHWTVYNAMHQRWLAAKRLAPAASVQDGEAGR